VFVVPIGALAWVLMWSSLLKVRDISVNAGSESDAVRVMLADQIGRNILLVHIAALTAAVTHAFPSLRDVSVVKRYPRGITVSAVERTPIGIWCRGDACQLWDRDGIRWGETIPSVGALLVEVNDQRSDDSVSPEFMSGLMAAIDGLAADGMEARIVTLPDAEPGGLRVTTTASFDVYMDALGDVPDQLSTLAVFLGDHAHDPSFKPAYIDLRTPGRVYYK